MFKGSEYAYYAMYLVGFAIMMLVNLKTYKRYEISKKSAVVLTLITYFAGVYGAMVMGDMYSSIAVKYSEGGSTVAIFGAVVFTPLIMIAVSLFALKPWRNVIDMLAPGIFIILTCAKFGCFMAGCCPGRECSFGVYNPKLELTVFPSQLFESITMCFVVAFCFWYALKKKNCIKGSVYPVTAAVYSVTRFLWEYMRYYANEEMRRVMLGVTFWQFWCVVVIIASVIWVIVLRSEKIKSAELWCYSFIGDTYKKLSDKAVRFIHRNDKNIVHHKKRKKK